MRRFLILLLLALVAACSDGGPVARTDSGIEGLVTIGPTCPVESPGMQCGDEPYSVDLFVVERNSRRMVARVRSGDDGRFRVTLTPGEYSIIPAPAVQEPPTAERPDVTVRPHAFARVTVRFDSGIR